MPAAARIGDNHVCPMQTPGTPPIPHVGGPITGPGVPNVLIGGILQTDVGKQGQLVNGHINQLNFQAFVLQIREVTRNKLDAARGSSPTRRQLEIFHIRIKGRDVCSQAIIKPFLLHAQFVGV